MKVGDFEYEKKRVATEWDGCWFCYKCNGMHHWKEKANVKTTGSTLPVCNKCLEKILENISKNS